MNAQTKPNKPRSQAASKAAGHAAIRVRTDLAMPPGLSVKPRSGAKPVGKNVRQTGRPLSSMQTHDLVTEGLPVATARALMASFRSIDRGTVLKAIGISERTLQRATGAARLLDSNASDRTLRLASVAEQATDVLGSRDAAERWLATPAIGLDRRRPIDLLQSSEGTTLVRTLLTRMDYGVYA